MLVGLFFIALVLLVIYYGKCDVFRMENESLRKCVEVISRENEEMRQALAQIADEAKVYLGHGDYNIVPALTAEEAQDVARAALMKVGRRGTSQEEPDG